MANRAKHAFGNSSSIEAAKQANKIDAYDILFLDGDTEPKIGWIDKNGNTRIAKNEDVKIVEGEALPDTGESGKIYIFKDEGYFWTGTEFKTLSKSTDLTELEEQIATKVDETKVQEMIDATVESSFEVVEF